MQTISAIQVAILLTCIPPTQAQTQSQAIDLAVAALQRNDYNAAEQLLQDQLHHTPQDVAALGLLGVVLDQEKKYAEADDVYRRALSQAPAGSALLNNFGNHLIATGKTADARRTFLKVIGLEPSNANALIQLARLALQSHAPGEALRYLERVPSTRTRPDAVLLEMQADYLTGHQAAGDAILAKLSPAAEADADRALALGNALASAKQYGQAEMFYSKALPARPSDFNLIYSLALAASHAGHKVRARTLLEQAVLQQPGNVDALYDLAVVTIALDDKEAALTFLVRAAALDPRRFDVLLLEARTSSALGYFADAAAAWDKYLKLVPQDAVAKRERAFAQSASGENLAQSVSELAAFVRQHPSDAAGHYELGLAETTLQPDRALAELNRALLLDPNLNAAHMARGVLLYRQGKTPAALLDFEFAARKEPTNVVVLDRLGETYLALQRFAEALPVLQKAADLQPSNAAVLLHLGRALSKAGRNEEAAAVFSRSRSLGPNRTALARPVGLIDFLALSPDEQRTRYRNGIEQAVQHRPEDPEAQVRYLGLLLDDRRFSNASDLVRKLGEMSLPATLAREAVNMLESSGQYLLASQLLIHSGFAASPELALEYAIAALHLSGGSAALDELSKVSTADHGADYFLVRAQIMESLNRYSEADAALRQTASLTSARPILYLQTALLLLQHDRMPQASKLLADAAHVNGNEPDILLLQALAFELSNDSTNADLNLKNVEQLWPEWEKAARVRSALVEERATHQQAALRQALQDLFQPQ